MNRNATIPKVRLGEVLKSKRRKSGLSQVKVAHLVGCKATTITDIETGRRAPRNETVWRLGALFCLPKVEVLQNLELTAHHRKNRTAYGAEYIGKTIHRILFREKL